MPGLLRGVARTAVIAGTATAVSNRVSRRQARRWGDQDAAAGARSDACAAPAPAAPAARPGRPQLRELAKLRDDGILTEEEFADAEAQDPGLTRHGRAMIQGAVMFAVRPAVATVDVARRGERELRRRAGDGLGRATIAIIDGALASSYADEAVARIVDSRLPELIADRLLGTASPTS